MKKIDIESFLELKYLSNPSYSPDGKLIAFIVQEAEAEANKYLGNIWLMEAGTRHSRQLTTLGDAKKYFWTSKGTLIFSADRGGKKDQKATTFYEISPDGGEALEAFTIPLGGASIKPIDSTRYAVIAKYDNKPRNSDDEITYQVFDELPFWSNNDGYINGKRQRLYIYDTASKSLEAITDTLTDVEDIALGDGIIAYSGTPYESVKPRCAGVYCYNIASKSTVTVVPPGETDSGVFEFVKGRLILALTDGALYGSEQYLDFYVVDPVSGDKQKLADYEASIGYGSVGSDAKLGGGRRAKPHKNKFCFCSTVENSTILRSVDISGNIEDVFTQPGSCESFDVFEDNVIICGLYDGKPSELYDVDGTQLTHFNDAFMEEHSVITPEKHIYTGSDGFEIHGWALKPVNYTPGNKYPAILHIHGGPRTVFGDVLHHEMQTWANAGYFVFFCNPRGSDGRGNKFGYISGQYGTVEYQNLMEFADEMLIKYPDADRENFGVTGGSYGGFMTNWIIGQTKRFKAAVSQRSISNWIAMEHTSDIGHFFVKNQLLASTRSDMGKVWEQSPLKYAYNATTPTLFIHSERDHRCWMVEGISMYSALKMNGTDSRLCLFHDETHELSRSGKPKNRISRMTEIINWFDKYLK